MTETIILVGFALVLAGTVFVWRRVRVQEQSRARLADPDQPVEEALPQPSMRPFVRPYRVIPWFIGGIAFAVFYWLIGVPLSFAATFGFIISLIGSQLDSFRVSRATFLIEAQLADAIDLLVAGLRAGSGTLGALDNAALEAKAPLKPQLEELLGRIRYGDDPQTVLQALQARVPLESFRLFSSALSVHWETGGSLAPTLATVGRVIRDRTEVMRRIRALTMQARASIYAVLGVTYFIGLIIWRNDPDRMRQFLATTLGQGAVAGAIFMQAVGMVWATAMSRLRY